LGSTSAILNITALFSLALLLFYYGSYIGVVV
jgi:hypothetical protein